MCISYIYMGKKGAIGSRCIYLVLEGPKVVTSSIQIGRLIHVSVNQVSVNFYMTKQI